jgi:hypothetical protein
VSEADLHLHGRSPRETQLSAMSTHGKAAAHALIKCVRGSTHSDGQPRIHLAGTVSLDDLSPR